MLNKFRKNPPPSKFVKLNKVKKLGNYGNNIVPNPSQMLKTWKRKGATDEPEDRKTFIEDFIY